MMLLMKIIQMKIMKNKMKKTNLFIGLFLSVSTLFAQEITEPTLIKEASANPMDIPYEKWEMPNG